jgi:hypothetical protein
MLCQKRSGADSNCVASGPMRRILIVGGLEYVALAYVILCVVHASSVKPLILHIIDLL